MIPNVKDLVLDESLKVYYGVRQHKYSINVAIIAHKLDRYPTSSAFIRLISPLTYGVVGKLINLHIYSPADAILGISDNIRICIVQRTAFDSLENAVIFCEKVKKSGKKIIVDTDDAFSSLEPGHPQYDIQKKLIDAFQYVASQADIIWVSTKKLASEFDSRATVIRNTIDKRVWGKSSSFVMDPDDKVVTAVYMGTGTHDADLKMILPALDRINEKYNNRLQLRIIGVATSLPERDWIKKLIVINDITMYPKFVEWFMQQGPFDIGLAPLENSEFNKAKSDIKVLDYLNQGVLPIVSDIEPYSNHELDGFIVRVGYGVNDWYDFFEDIILHKKKYSLVRKSNLLKIKKYIQITRSTRTASWRMYKDIKKLL